MIGTLILQLHVDVWNSGWFRFRVFPISKGSMTHHKHSQSMAYSLNDQECCWYLYIYTLDLLGHLVSYSLVYKVYQLIIQEVKTVNHHPFLRCHAHFQGIFSPPTYDPAGPNFHGVRRHLSHSYHLLWAPCESWLIIISIPKLRGRKSK